MWDLWWTQSGAGAGFLQVFGFPLPIFISPISLQSPSPIIWGWYNRPVVAAVPKVPLHKEKEEEKKTPNFSYRIIIKNYGQNCKKTD
jgi:hypothetical protein